MNVIYLLLLITVLCFLRKAGRCLPVWFANSLAWLAILLSAGFIGWGMFHASSTVELAVASLCLSGVPIAEAYWLSNEKVC